MSESAEIASGATIKPIDAPQSKSKAESLLRSLGYENVTVYRVESDRIIATVVQEGKQVAITVCLRFDLNTERVHIYPVDGWPAE